MAAICSAAGFASVISVFLAGWFRNLILSGHAKDDGTDVRGLVISGYFICCLAAPVAYELGRLIGLDASVALAAVVLSVAIGLFELTQDLVRARLRAITAMKATLVRAVSVLCLGVVVALFCPTGFLLLLSSALACLLAVLVQSRAAWRGTIVKFDVSGLAAVAWQGLPLTLSLTLLAVSSVTDRFMIANLVGAAEAGKYVAGLDLVRQTLMIPAISAAAAFFPLAVQDPCQAGQCSGAIASRRVRRAAARHHAAGLPGLCRHLIARRQCRSRRRLPRGGRAGHADRGRRRDLPGPDAAISACELSAFGTQFAVFDQHRLDHRRQCDPVLRSGQQATAPSAPPGRGWAPTSSDLSVRWFSAVWHFPFRFRCGRLGADHDRRSGHGAGRRDPRQKPACFGSGRVRHPGRAPDRPATPRCAGCSISPGPAGG